MSYFKERFGLESIKLSTTEKYELKKRIKELNFKRIEFFSIFSFLYCAIFITLDIIDYYPSIYKIFYLISDFIFLIVSAIIISSSILKGHKRSKNKFSLIFLNLYPFICLIWASGIATLNPASMMNMVTFYIAFFLLTFFLTSSVIIYVLYFVTSITVYFILSIILNHPVFNETLAMLLAGSFITIPFYSSFKTNKENSISALIKLNKSNLSLENEVSQKIIQLKEVNEDLGNEIVRRKIVEAKLRDALTKAETSDRLKSEFLANISHEIRTPLNAIIGFSEMLTEDGVNKEQKIEFQKLIGSNTMFLLSTIDDIFDASMANTNQINSVKASFKVNNFLESIFYELNGIIIKYNSKNISMVPIRLSNNEIEIDTDEFYLKKAFLRLIDNAFKFTSEGSIEVGAKFSKSELEFFVKDSGIGISKDNQEKIFEPFVQGDGSFTRDYGGSGLGLSIVSGIAEELGCYLSFDSEKDKGSTFRLIFQREEAK